MQKKEKTHNAGLAEGVNDTGSSTTETARHKWCLTLSAVDETESRVAGEVIGGITMDIPEGLSAEQIRERYLTTAGECFAQMIEVEQ